MFIKKICYLSNSIFPFLSNMWSSWNIMQSLWMSYFYRNTFELKPGEQLLQKINPQLQIQCDVGSAVSQLYFLFCTLPSDTVQMVHIIIKHWNHNNKIKTLIYQCNQVSCCHHGQKVEQMWLLHVAHSVHWYLSERKIKNTSFFKTYVWEDAFLLFPFYTVLWVAYNRWEIRSQIFYMPIHYIDRCFPESIMNNCSWLEVSYCFVAIIFSYFSNENKL